MSKMIEMAGAKVGLLTVIRRADNITTPNGTFAAWECVCDCGNHIIARGYCLRSGNTTSCGCRRKETLSALMTTHGQSNTRLYQIWCGMKKRCYNPRASIYKHYGGRGIKMCTEWRDDYMAFHNWATVHGYTGVLSIDRIDVNGDYTPSNSRWVTDLVQANNTRANRNISYKGITKTAAEWTRHLAITKSKWDWLLKKNDGNAQLVIAACAAELATGGQR